MVLCLLIFGLRAICLISYPSARVGSTVSTHH